MTITLSNMTPSPPVASAHREDMAVIADLHIHSTASDGEYTPAQLAEMLNKKMIRVAALADHDSFAGFSEFKKHFKGLSVPGVELSVQYKDIGLHLLAYGFNPTDRAFRERLEHFQTVRYQRIEAMCERLTDLGKPIRIDEIRSNYPYNTLGRPHIARAMIAKGYIKTFNDAFNKYIGDGKPAYIPKTRIDFDEALELIKAAGGISILAHPGLFLDHMSFDVMKKLPVHGFEAYHPNHSRSISRILIDHCLNHDIPYTGGSDFHDLRRNKTNVLGKWGLRKNEWDYVRSFLKDCCTYDI